MGCSDSPEMQFNLDGIIHIEEDLSNLVEPFTTEEIDTAVKNMPTDKSLGPDGFNGKFLKKCCHIVKEDFYQLVQEFYNTTINLQVINNSFITLIPKVMQSSESQ
uniref:Reverse transcriptase domain-containing protein n=1 Tax=Arundo donax TaxID=35708 RepID=A0A0A8ZA07_ARUDO